MHRLFDFTKKEEYRLMLDMAKEIHAAGESEDIIRRFQEMDLEKMYAVCHEHELDGVVGSYALSLGLTLPAEWLKEYERQLEEEEERRSIEHEQELMKKAKSMSKSDLIEELVLAWLRIEEIESSRYYYE